MSPIKLPCCPRRCIHDGGFSLLTRDHQDGLVVINPDPVLQDVEVKFDHSLFDLKCTISTTKKVFHETQNVDSVLDDLEIQPESSLFEFERINLLMRTQTQKVVNFFGHGISFLTPSESHFYDAGTLA